MDETHKIQKTYHYDAFGTVLEESGDTLNRLTYTGQQYDTATGQYYLRARFYNPALGRFLQEDVYRGDGLNLYAYCKNHPVGYYDPSGYMSFSCDLKQTAGESGRGTGTVWDNITPTQPMRDGTQIPLSFNIDINGQKFWVTPNGTKHMQEYITRDGQHIGTFTTPVSSQAMLAEFESSLSTAIKNNGLVFDEMIYGGGWEFIIVPPRQEGLNNVIKHARYNPQ